MGAAGQQLGLRLFLEGMEVPVVAAQVQIGINAPATASIQVVPSDKLTALKARTMVHIFFWDYTLDSLPPPLPPDIERTAAQYGITTDEAKDLIAERPDVFATPEQEELRGYKLLFSGEIVGVVYMKTPGDRQAILQCADFSTYWDTTYQFFVSYSPGGNFLGTSAAVWAGADSMFDDLTAGHVSVLNEYLRSKPQTPGLTGIKGLMGGIIALLEAMGGVPNHTHGVNDFFTIAELKNHLLQQIVAEQNDDTAQRLFDEKAFMDWLTKGMSSLGQLATFRDMMKLLFQYVYYEVVPNPAAMYTKAKQSQATTKRVTVTTKVELPANLRTIVASIANTTSINSKRSWLDEPFNEQHNAQSLKAVMQKTLASASMPKIYKTKLEQTYPWFDKIHSDAADMALQSKSKAGLVAQAGVGSPINPIPPSDNFKNNKAAWAKITDIINDVLGQDVRFSSSRNVPDRTAPELDRLGTQIFRPDCFFAAPPRCNVIFPDQYTQFQFSRNFLQETTRLRLGIDWLFGGDSGGLLAEYHFAPATSDIEKLAKLQGNDGLRALLPWEIYSGILPKFESIHEMNFVAGQAELRKGIKGNIQGAAVDYAQRTANFNYFKYRFASRTCELNTKFNPWLICGFPGLVIDRPFILEPNQAQKVRDKILAANPNQKFDDMSDFVRAAANDPDVQAPTQYLGMIAAVGHNVTQEGGVTSLTMTHARTHRITDDDFLSLISTEISKEVDTQIVSTVLSADDLFKKGDWKLLKLLRDATPQNLDKQVSNDVGVGADGSLDGGLGIGDDSTNSPPLETRPTGAPTVDDLPGSSQFGSLLSPVGTEPRSSVTVVSQRVGKDGTSFPITGNVKEERLLNSRQVILVPDPGGVLVVGSTKGPKNGTIVQIQCVSDAAVGLIDSASAKSLAAGKKVDVSSSLIDQFDVDPATGARTLQGNIIDGAKVSYFWKSIVIYEQITVTKNVTKLLPIEEAIRPPWFSPLYSNWFIGEEIYTPFFGCGSIVDQALFTSPQGNATFGTSRAQQQQVLDQLKAAGNDRNKVLQIIQDAKAKNISDIPDIESSTDALAYIYGEVKRLNLDVHRFVHDYTRRPIATMEEILGSDDLAYKQDGNKLVLVSGVPGFHSTAIADVGGQLLGLLDNPDLALPRLKNGSGGKSPVSKAIDPRPGRRAKVVEYLTDISASSGSLGVGVAG